MDGGGDTAALASGTWLRLGAQSVKGRLRAAYALHEDGNLTGITQQIRDRIHLPGGKVVLCCAHQASRQRHAN